MAKRMPHYYVMFAFAHKYIEASGSAGCGAGNGVLFRKKKAWRSGGKTLRKFEWRVSGLHAFAVTEKVELEVVGENGEGGNFHRRQVSWETKKGRKGALVLK